MRDYIEDSYERIYYGTIESIKAFKNRFSKIDINIIEESIFGITKGITRENVSKTLEELPYIILESMSKVSDSLSETDSDFFDDIFQKIFSLDSEKLLGNINLQDFLNNLFVNLEFDDATTQFNEIAKTIGLTTEEIANFYKILITSKNVDFEVEAKDFENVAKAIQITNKAQQEYAETNKITTSSIKDLEDANIKYVISEDGIVSILDTEISLLHDYNNEKLAQYNI